MAKLVSEENTTGNFIVDAKPGSSTGTTPPRPRRYRSSDRRFCSDRLDDAESRSHSMNICDDQCEVQKAALSFDVGSSTGWIKTLPFVRKRPGMVTFP